jgi:hypothetical protein
MEVIMATGHNARSICKRAVVIHFLSGNRARQNTQAYDADRTREYTWSAQDVPAFKLSKRVYVEILQSECYVAKFVLKEFAHKANEIGLKAGGYVNHNVVVSVETTPIAAYSSSRDNRRKVMHITLSTEAEHRVPEVIAILKEHIDDSSLTETLVYSDDLYKLDGDQGHYILKCQNFEPWRNSRITELCEEILPISPQRCIFTLKGGVSVDEFAAHCITWNEAQGLDHPIQKILYANGMVFRPIHKIRTDATGNYRPKDLPRETPHELKLKLRGIDHVDIQGYLQFAIPHMITKICELTGLGKHKGAFELPISSGGQRVLQFYDATFANIFYFRYNNFHDEQDGGLIRWTLDNDRFKSIGNKVPQLLMIKGAALMIDVQEFEAAVDGSQFDRAALCN